MVYPESSIPYNLLKKIIVSGNAPMVLFFFIISQYVLKLIFICPCSSTPFFRDVMFTMYMCLPSLTLFLLVFLKDRHFIKTITFCQNICNGRLGKTSLKGLTLTAMWIITTFFDGDWYICQKTAKGNHSEILCKEKRSTEDDLIYNKFKTESQVCF